MLSTLLILLGSALMLVTIMIVIFFIIGVLRRSLVNIKVLTASGIIELLMIVLGVLPWGIAEVVGLVALAAASIHNNSAPLVMHLSRLKMDETLSPYSI